MTQKRAIRCPKCRLLDTKRYGKRFLRSIEKSVTRISCRSCNYTGPIRFFSRVRADTESCIRIVRESLERASLRILARRYRKSKNTVMTIIRDVVSTLADSAAIAGKFRPQWSGVLVFDGKVARVYDELATKLDRKHFSEDELRWMHKARRLCGIDHGTGDLPHHDLAEAESRIELIMYFQKLKALNYRLVALVCDGNPEIPHAAKFVFGDGVVVQRRTRHFLEDLRRLLPAESERREERAKLEQLIALVKDVIEAESLEIADAHYAILKRQMPRSRSLIARQMLVMFEELKAVLTAHLMHHELRLPHTSNDIESLFKQLNLRLKSLGRFFCFRFARDYLNAWALLRRFTPFTDCCKARRHRNGKAPLELAGAHIMDIDPLKLKK